MAVFGCTIVKARRYCLLFFCSSLTALALLVLTARLVFHDDSLAVEKSGSFQTATASGMAMAGTNTSSQRRKKKPHCVKIPAVNGGRVGVYNPQIKSKVQVTSLKSRHLLLKTMDQPMHHL